MRLEISPTISQVSGTSDQISAGVFSPRIDIREIQTTVTIRDGQTIVIGGLIQTTLVDRETKVPFFGDFPIIGPLFRSTDTNIVKTELLVILTPTIIPGDGVQHATRVNQIIAEEISRRSNSETLLKIVEEMQRGPAKSDSAPDADAPGKGDKSGEKCKDEVDDETEKAHSKAPTGSDPEEPGA